MPIEKWCRERGISKQTYYRWQKRVFEAAQRQQQVEFAEVRTSESLQLPATGGSECEKPGLSSRFLSRLCKLLKLCFSGNEQSSAASFPVFPPILASFPDAEAEIHPDRISGNKKFRKDDEVRFLCGSLGDPLKRLFQRCALIKQDRFCLHQCDFTTVFYVFHGGRFILPENFDSPRCAVTLLSCIRRLQALVSLSRNSPF